MNHNYQNINDDSSLNKTDLKASDITGNLSNLSNLNFKPDNNFSNLFGAGYKVHILFNSFIVSEKKRVKRKR